MAVINGDTGISIDVLLGTLPLLIGCVVVWLQLRGIRKYLKKVWTVPDQRVWCERLQSHNHDLKLVVPDPDEVLRTFNGKSQ